MKNNNEIGVVYSGFMTFTGMQVFCPEDGFPSYKNSWAQKWDEKKNSFQFFLF